MLRKRALSDLSVMMGHMSVRSDFSLDVQLERVLDAVVHPDVKTALVSARQHMTT